MIAGEWEWEWQCGMWRWRLGWKVICSLGEDGEGMNSVWVMRGAEEGVVGSENFEMGVRMGSCNWCEEVHCRGEFGNLGVCLDRQRLRTWEMGKLTDGTSDWIRLVYF